MYTVANTSAIGQVRWLEVTNAGTSTIPAFGAVRITGSGTDGILRVDIPNADNQHVLINGPIPINAGKKGVCTQDEPVYAAYTGSGNPLNDDSFGAQAGSYYLRAGYSGFIALGGATSGRVMVRRAPQRTTFSPRFRFYVSGSQIIYDYGAQYVSVFGSQFVFNTGWTGFDINQAPGILLGIDVEYGFQYSFQAPGVPFFGYAFLRSPLSPVPPEHIFDRVTFNNHVPGRTNYVSVNSDICRISGSYLFKENRNVVPALSNLFEFGTYYEYPDYNVAVTRFIVWGVSMRQP